MSAVRFAMFAERATTVLAEARSVQSMPFSRGMSAHDRGTLAKSKMAAAHDIETFEPMLYPPDEPVN